MSLPGASVRPPGGRWHTDPIWVPDGFAIWIGPAPVWPSVARQAVPIAAGDLPEEAARSTPPPAAAGARPWPASEAAPPSEPLQADVQSCSRDGTVPAVRLVSEELSYGAAEWAARPNDDGVEFDSYCDAKAHALERQLAAPLPSVSPFPLLSHAGGADVAGEASLSGGPPDRPGGAEEDKDDTDLHADTFVREETDDQDPVEGALATGTAAVVAAAGAEAVPQVHERDESHSEDDDEFTFLAVDGLLEELATHKCARIPLFCMKGALLTMAVDDAPLAVHVKPIHKQQYIHRTATRLLRRHGVVCERLALTIICESAEPHEIEMAQRSFEDFLRLQDPQALLCLTGFSATEAP